MNEAEQKLKEAQQKTEEAIRAATAQAEAMARKMVMDMLSGKMDYAQVMAAMQGMMGQLQGQAGQRDSPYRTLGLDPSAPDDVVRVVYRFLARKHHPDRGGSEEEMTKLNRAYETIWRERGWR